MSMKHRLMLTLVLLVSIPMLVSVAAGTWFAESNSSDLLVEQAEQKLISMREFRKRGVEDFYAHIQRQISATAKADAVIDATVRFGNSYFDFLFEAGISEKINDLNAGLKQYYSDQFEVEYQKENPESMRSFKHLFEGLNENSMAIQSQYISENEFPSGEKEKLKFGGDMSNYSIFHKRYHGQFLYALQSNGYQDIIIADSETGEVMYSVYKKVDFATSLIKGPFADSGAGEAFRAALKADSPAFTYLTDFAYYTPSYDDPAAFISAPIYKSGVIIGVLIFQVSFDTLNNILTSGNRWKQDGLGDTGEVYLVGADRLMRTDSRFLIEDPDNYYQQVSQAGVEETSVLRMQSHNTSILMQPVNTIGVENALNGETGFEIFPDYRDVSVLSAYASLEIQGLDWVIMSQMDAEEAFAPAHELSGTLLTSSAGVAVIMLVVAVLLGFWFTSRLTKPVERLEHEILEVENNSDLSFRLHSEKGDVTSGIVESLNNMLEKMYGIISMVASSSLSIAEASSNMNEISKVTAKDVIGQKDETDQVVIAIEKLNKAVVNVSANADDASNAAKEANNQANQGDHVVSAATESIGKLAKDVQSASEAIAHLANESNNIGGVLDVIRGIAEQTNLLALNAAIEAARAGEQGRGFAVVADEVRTLASRTGESTEEIHKMIEGLQTGAKNAVTVMERGQQQVQISVEQTNGAAEVLKNIITEMAEITSMNEQIAESSNEQRAVADQVTCNMNSIADISNSTTTNAQKTKQASEKLNQLAVDLNSAVAQFKLQ